MFCIYCFQGIDGAEHLYLPTDISTLRDFMEQAAESWCKLTTDRCDEVLLNLKKSAHLAIHNHKPHDSLSLCHMIPSLPISVQCKTYRVTWMKIPIFYQCSHALMFSVLFFICGWCHIMCTCCYKTLDWSSDSKHLDLFRVSFGSASKLVQLPSGWVFLKLTTQCFTSVYEEVYVPAYCCHVWLILLRLKWKYHNFMGGLFLDCCLSYQGIFDFL